jgi:hypothetical protein
MLIRWLAVATGVFAMVMACGSDDSGDGGTGGAAGAAGSSTGGAGGTAGSATGGTGGITTGGTGGGSAGQAGAASCGDYGQVAACQTCLAGHCCTEGGNCKSNADCDGFVTCARACPDPTDTSSACIQTCATTWNAPNANYNALIVCMGTNCGTDCGYL